MDNYIMLVYESYDSENPYVIRYVGDDAGAVDKALREQAFEVDIYRGTEINPDTESVCAVMYTGEVLYD